MKRTAKVLSLAMVAFMLSGCNLFNKSSDGEVKWQEFDFDESQRLDEAKAADLLNHAKLALEEFSDVSIVEKEMLSLNNYESEGETTIKIKAYSNSLVVEEKKTSEKVKEDGITLSAKTEKKTQSLDVRYMDGLDEKTVTLKYADASDSGVTMSRSYLDSSVYEQTLTAQSISVPTGLAIYQVKKQYFAVESTVTEYVDYIPYESGVKEQLMEMKAQTVYTFDSEKRLVSCTNYNEAIANRDDMDGSWYKKAKTVLKYTKSKSISYKARSEGNASQVKGAFENEFFAGELNPQVAPYYVSEGYIPASMAMDGEVVVKQVSSNKFHAEAVVSLTFSETANAVTFVAYADTYDDYKDDTATNKIGYVTGLDADAIPGFTSNETSAGQMFILSGEPRTVVLSMSFDVLTDPTATALLKVENAKFSVVL